jgi:hypothetical protein
VNWRALEDCSDEISSTIRKRAPMGFVMTDMIQSVIDQTKKELKRKQEAEEAKTPGAGGGLAYLLEKKNKKRKHNNSRIVIAMIPTVTTTATERSICRVKIRK